MKNLLLIIFCGFSFCSFAQVHSAMPPEASLFYTNAMNSIKPAIKSLIETDAHKLKNRNINADSLNNKLKNDPLLKGMKQHDIEAVGVLIMVQASKNADAELKNLVMNMHKTNEQNSAENETEMILEHKSKIAEAIAVSMKKISPSEESVINNLK